MRKAFMVIVVIMVALVFSYTNGFSLNKDKSRDDLYRELEIFAEGLAVVEKKYVVSPIHNHPLVETTRDKQCLSYTNGFTCDICGYTHKEEYFYHCEECYKANPSADRSRIPV